MDSSEDPGQESTIALEPETGAAVARPPVDSPYIHVEVIGGAMDGQDCRTASNELTIGRSERNDMPLRHDRTVSQRHARIVREEGGIFLEDLESSNGTFLGSQRIHGRTAIGPGTVFVVGRTALELAPS